MSELQQLAKGISEVDEEVRQGLEFDFQPLPGDVDVMQVTIKEREEMPVYMTMADNQLLCICYLWDESQVNADKKHEMSDAMLRMNVPMPLSSFAIIPSEERGDQYAIFGAMSLNSSSEDIALELATLSDNAIDAIEVMSEYLI
ncbi:MAG: YjfI family protein [Nitrosopumilus sp.]|nr:YjfI family protein [Gammaproteobacteria bacterium]MDH5666335.1 YjfI family protein [Nitrosopumilus sp.]MDH5730692.1 YjfI family protein [Gammaproteobacteria bacterium]